MSASGCQQPSRNRESWLIQMQPLARNLARRYALSPDEEDDLVQEAMWSLYCELKRTDLSRMRKPHAFARAVMRHAVLSAVRRNYRCAEREVVVSDLSPRAVTGALADRRDNEVVALNAVTLENYLVALEGCCGVLARKIVTNLLAPTSPEVCTFIIREAERKRRRSIRTGAHLRGIKRLRISRCQVRMALGLRGQQWSKQLRAIRAFTAQWLRCSKVLQGDSATCTP